MASIVLSDYRSDFSVSLGTPENSAIQKLSIIIIIIILKKAGGIAPHFSVICNVM